LKIPYLSQACYKQILYIARFAYRCHEENGIALIATVNNQRREIVVEGVIPKGEAPEKVKVLIIHQLGDYVKNKQTLSSCWLNDVSMRNILENSYNE